jgi:cytochrome c oxidase assembly protein subunit 15
LPRWSHRAARGAARARSAARTDSARHGHNPEASATVPGPFAANATARDFAITARLATATAALMFALIVIGSIVRTTGSGLACPDWPLCQGRLIPPFQFNVLIEWFHRLVALVVGLGLLATAVWVAVHRATRARLGGLAALSIALYLTQALLGALTVWKLLDPNVVSGHLAVALLLFATLLTLGLIARHETQADWQRDAAARARPAGLLPLFGGATAAIWAQAVLGGMVSTNHASLACPDWPTCNGDWFPPMIGLIALQMGHRLGAYLLAGLLALVAWRSRVATDTPVRGIGTWLFLLVLVQGGIGVANILLGIPVWVSALHLATAAFMLALSLVATFRLSTQPSPARAFVQAVAR